MAGLDSRFQRPSHCLGGRHFTTGQQLGRGAGGEVDPPAVPRNPAAPNRPILLLGVLFAGLAAGAGTAFVMSQLQASFTTAEKLERVLDLPVVGTISRSMTEMRQAQQRKQFKQFAGGLAGLVGICVILLAVEFIQVGSVA